MRISAQAQQQDFYAFIPLVSFVYRFGQNIVSLFIVLTVLYDSKNFYTYNYRMEKIKESVIHAHLILFPIMINQEPKKAKRNFVASVSKRDSGRDLHHTHEQHWDMDRRPTDRLQNNLMRLDCPTGIGERHCQSAVKFRIASNSTLWEQSKAVSVPIAAQFTVAADLFTRHFVPTFSVWHPPQRK